MPETETRERFLIPSSGVYQHHHPQLISTVSASHHEPEQQHIAKSAVGLKTETTTSPQDLVHSSSDNSATGATTKSSRYRSSSIESENLTSSVVMGRYRSGSMGSESSHRTPELASAPSSLKQQSHGDGSRSPGALYVGTDDNISFNQRMGNCIFICGFNMQCLRAEFNISALGGCPTFRDYSEVGTYAQSLHSQNGEPEYTQVQSRRPEPLPDAVQGRVIEVEHVIWSRHVRQRFRFLSHLPLGTAVSFVEINLGNVLSQQTKKALPRSFIVAAIRVIVVVVLRNVQTTRHAEKKKKEWKVIWHKYRWLTELFNPKQSMSPVMHLVLSFVLRDVLQRVTVKPFNSHHRYL